MADDHYDALPTESVVVEHQTCKVMYHNEKQIIPLSKCVQKIFLSPFYGEFKLYDKADRLLGESKNSQLSFLEKDLQTEVAQVWYHATSLCREFKLLKEKYHVADPGLCFTQMDEVYLQFCHGKSMEQNQVIRHIPVFFNVTNIWESGTKECLYM